MKTLICLSGGIDSAVVLAMTNGDREAIGFDPELLCNTYPIASAIRTTKLESVDSYLLTSWYGAGRALTDLCHSCRKRMDFDCKPLACQLGHSGGQIHV